MVSGVRAVEPAKKSATTSPDVFQPFSVGPLTMAPNRLWRRLMLNELSAAAPLGVATGRVGLSSQLTPAELNDESQTTAPKILTGKPELDCTFVCARSAISDSSRGIFATSGAC